VQQLLDEQVGSADDRPEADEELEDHGRCGRVVARRAIHDQRPDRVLLLHGAATAQGRPYVDRVGGDEDDREGDVEHLGNYDSHQDPGAEEDQEEDQVAVEGLDVGLQPPALLTAVLERERRDAHQRHGDRRQQKRGTDDGPDRDVLRTLGAADDCDDRDQRLGHRGADGREHAARGPLPEPELVSGPLDGVGEQQRPREDHRERRREQDVLHRRPLPRVTQF
jgi:hypothetical protein